MSFQFYKIVTWPDKGIDHVPKSSEDGDVAKLSDDEQNVVSDQIKERPRPKSVQEPVWRDDIITLTELCVP